MIDLRQADPTFDYQSFADPVHVIGIGGIGSHVVRHLARGGFQAPLHLWDGDHVELKNLRNQTYDRDHIGLLKTEALSQQVCRWRGQTALQHTQFILDAQPLSGIVFLCVDTMVARKQIWESCIKNNSEVPLFVETRMDGINILIHVLDPCNPDHQFEWNRYWYPDQEAVNETAGCGGPVAVLPSASMAADLAVWHLMRYAAKKTGTNDTLDNQIRVTLRPLTLETRQW